MEILCFHVTEENVLQSFCGWILPLKVGKLSKIYGNGINNKPTDLVSFFSGHENT